MRKFLIVQQSAWHMTKESMPLAAGYILSSISGDDRINKLWSYDYINLVGSTTPLEIIIQILKDGVPDVIGFSVFGWNYQNFLNVARTLKQYNRSCIIIFGGVHVTNQAVKVLSESNYVDIIVNGEGEITIPDILNSISNNKPYKNVQGISYKNVFGKIVTTQERKPIENLNEIPSPILNGIISLKDDSGRFRYDVALMETNRGCPYRCSYCNWGGATGQKIRSFSLERIRKELWVLADAGAETVVLCDSNFGMNANDLDFVNAIIEIKQKLGRPKALEASWAKNKNEVFYEIVEKMKEAELQSSFTIALQSLNSSVLSTMNRKNMLINDWKEHALWLKEKGLDVYAELIWGAPGESYESFLSGYDELSIHVSRIATYPLILLPNTEYSEFREKYKFKTVKGENDDFEYILGSDNVNLDQHLLAWRFIFWARLLAENLVLRYIWPLGRMLLGISQSSLIISFADYIESIDDPDAEFMAEAAKKSVGDPDSLAPVLEFCFTNLSFDKFVWKWWDEVLKYKTPADYRDLFSELLQFDLDSRPLVHPKQRGIEKFNRIYIDNIPYWRIVKNYEYKILDIVQIINANEPKLEEAKTYEHSDNIVLLFKIGFEDIVRSTNHEETAHYLGQVYHNKLIETEVMSYE